MRLPEMIWRRERPSTRARLKVSANIRESLISDIDSLEIYAGIHETVFGFYRLLAKRFPYAIYYSTDQNTIFVRAILDCRRAPKFLRHKLNK